MDSRIQEYRYYLDHWSKKYVKVEVILSMNRIAIYNVYTNDGKCLAMQHQNGETDLEPHEFIEVGRILELHKQVESGKLEYDPHILWTDEDKKWYLP
jgi:hypothetical protein